ncbi:hypothetical protein CVT24_007151 [Panaeolus cyanescens]|uniref:glutaminase n=1 Tax=Panaeolus cyanescens TaxID=181874 RepID=A0A409YPH7_9AGAR|nr:hypothetical protein CVT24_007151 [Panaeolus cyanescens]
MTPVVSRIGILALQGAFVEHKAALERLPYHRKLEVIFVKTPEELAQCDALIIPGGESTTIALLARLSGLFEPLKEFVKDKPVWGTCAGAILLSQVAENTKKGGQELLVVAGTETKLTLMQVESFEAELTVSGLKDPERPFNGFFIRAPVVVKLHPGPEDPPIQVIASLSPNLLPPALQSPDHSDEPKTFVGLRQGLHFLTTFHPELTNDDRFHEYFVRECVFANKRT